MAERIEVFDMLVPAGTSIAGAISEAFTMNEGIVERVEILVPPGPSGLMGFRIVHSGEPVIPYDRSKWIIADNDTLKWDLQGYPEGSAWGCKAYNTDAFDHTLYFRFFLNETRRSLTDRVALVPIDSEAFAEDLS